MWSLWNKPVPKTLALALAAGGLLLGAPALAAVERVILLKVTDDETLPARQLRIERASDAPVIVFADIYSREAEGARSLRGDVPNDTFQWELDCGEGAEGCASGPLRASQRQLDLRLPHKFRAVKVRVTHPQLPEVEAVLDIVNSEGSSLKPRNRGQGDTSHTVVDGPAPAPQAPAPAPGLAGGDTKDTARPRGRRGFGRGGPRGSRGGDSKGATANGADSGADLSGGVEDLGFHPIGSDSHAGNGDKSGHSSETFPGFSSDGFSSSGGGFSSSGGGDSGGDFGDFDFAGGGYGFDDGFGGYGDFYGDYGYGYGGGGGGRAKAASSSRRETVTPVITCSHVRAANGRMELRCDEPAKKVLKVAAPSAEAKRRAQLEAIKKARAKREEEARKKAAAKAAAGAKKKATAPAKQQPAKRPVKKAPAKQAPKAPKKTAQLSRKAESAAIKSTAGVLLSNSRKR